MDFGVVGLDGFVDSTTEAPSDPETKLLKSLGSAFPKQNRSGFVDDDCHWRNSKIPKTDSGVSVASKTMPLHQGFPLLRSNTMLSVSSDGHQKEHMLSFSSVKSESCLQNKDCEMVGRNNQTSIFPYHQQKSSVYSRNTGCVSGSYSGSMHGPVAGIRGPFTPSQWIELEHQALIYKYLSSNVAVPSNLLIPLKKSLYPYGLTCSSAGSLPSNSRWGSFHLGFSGNTDPEPGRCRRTDGKKWRCSRDAVADQKYCERHINRGRHRSRKPVEGQSGHAAPGTTNPTPMVATMTSSLSSPVMPSGGASNNLPIMQHQLKSMHPGAASNPGADAPVNRLPKKGTVCSRIHEPGGLSMMSSTVNPMSNKSGVKQEISLGESAQSEFGFVSSDSLLNPSQRGSYVNSKNYDSFLIFNDQEAQDQDQHPLRQFFEDWPKDQSSRSVMTWPEEFKSDWTQLSMSIPMSDFSSSSSSPTHDKLAQSPLRLSRELEPIQMNLGVSRNDSELLQKQTNQIAMSWGTSMGGPLGEALTNASSCVKASRVPPSLNLLSEGWDGGHLGSSPTGVLQKSTFCSLSNSS